MASFPAKSRFLSTASPVLSTRRWVAIALLVLAGTAQAAQVTINGPTGSGEFGRTVTTLPNGNIVVTDPGYDGPGPIADVGAVYLYRPSGTLISTLFGSSASDRVGDGGVIVLGNGNFVVRSPNWDNGVAVDAGAVTFASGTSGISGVVSPANSLVGSTAVDVVGSSGVTALRNGNYVVRSPEWDNGAVVNAGAVTFASGASGLSGVVSAANSLVGSTADDRVGDNGVTALSNGNYVVRSPNWDNGAAVNAGAVTFASGASGISGVVSSANSLVGSTASDQVGSGGVTALSNGNYVVRSRNWDNGAIADVGAVTLASGTSGLSGVVSPANSLVGSTASDQVGSSGVTALSNGNYVVASRFWDNGAITNAGAATFGSGTSGISGVVSAANSLVGSTADDRVGIGGVTALSNGNYVVRSPNWDNGAIVDAGAVTFASGTSGLCGVVSPANSLVGSATSDNVGSFGVTALSNGNYVVTSPAWDNGAVVNAGAVTFASGASGLSGVVSAANSLVGSTTGNSVGSSGVTALRNGNYVVGSTNWDNGAIADVGAVTFASGTSGISGVVSAANSLVGSSTGDNVGIAGVTALSNGNYVVNSGFWHNGAITKAGAVTFASGTSGLSGVVSPANSLVGSTASDQVGIGGVIALNNGNYVVGNPVWDNGAIADAGAATFGSGTSGLSGVVSPANSLVGSTAGDQVSIFGVIALGNGNFVLLSFAWDDGAIVNAGAITLGLFNGSVVGPITSTHSVLGTVASQGSTQTFSYDPLRNQLAVGQPASNRVILQRTGIATAISIVGDTPDPSLGGQPVTFTATVSASPAAPTDGQVTFTASTGESCVDTTPTATSATTANYSCTITFTANGVSTVVAEYTGSIIHAYSGSGPESHTTIVDPVFANGFESP
jgi:hypothetical protein